MYWYEEEVQRLEKERKELSYRPATLFYGSSSIRLWQTLQEDLKVYKPVNLGFGGSTLAACVWFFERTLAPFSPDSLVLYAGDNDLGDGRHPEEVFIFFQQFVAQVKQHFGAQLPCYFISFKPSPSRWHLIENFKYANRIIEAEIVQHHLNWKYINIYDQMLNADGQPDHAYFEGDGLHMNHKGYALWTKILQANMPPVVQAELLL